MFATLKKKIRAFIQKYPLLVRLSGVLQRTPTHALHWYGILVFSIVLVVANVALAGFTFRSATSGTFFDDSQMTQPSTINRDTLEKTIQLFEARTVEFERAQQLAPVVIDPGR